MGGGGAVPQRGWSASRALVVLGALLAAGHAALFWMLDAMPFQDLPNHLARAAIEVDLLLRGGARFGREFAIVPWFAPYSAGDAMLAGLVAIFGQDAAGRLWPIVVAASLPLALAVYLRVTRHDRFTILLASVVALYLATDTFFLFGMHHFRLAVALVLLALAAWEVWLRSGSAGAYVAWTAVVAVGYLIHLSALVFTGAAAGVTALVSLWTRETRWSRVLAGALPGVALLGWQATRGRGVPSGAVTWMAAEKASRALFPFHRYDTLPDAVLLLIFSGLCLLLLLGGRAALSDRRFVIAGLISVLFLVVYAALPLGSGQIWYLDVRAMPVAATFALVAALSAAEHGRRYRAAAVALALALAAANLALLAYHLPRQNAVMRDYRALAALLPPGARVFPVDSAPGDGWTFPLRHAGAFATLDAGAYTPYLFAAGVTPYFHYRARPDVPVGENWYHAGLTLDARQRETIAASFDYVLIGLPYDPARLPLPVEGVARNRSAELLRIVR